MISRLKKQGGFSLVEVLVYLALFVIISTASVSFLISLNRLIDQYQMETMLYRSGTGAMEQILLAIRQADSVDLINTTEDSPASGRLTVDNAVNSTSFTLSSGALLMEIDGEEYGDLLVDGVTVTGFTVYYYPLSQGGEFVRVKLELSGAHVDMDDKELVLYGGATVRGAINND